MKWIPNNFDIKKNYYLKQMLDELGWSLLKIYPNRITIIYIPARGVLISPEFTCVTNFKTILILALSVGYDYYSMSEPYRIYTSNDFVNLKYSDLITKWAKT